MKILFSGTAGAPGISSGPVKIVSSLSDLSSFQRGEIAVMERPNPVLISRAAKNGASAFIIEKGNKTSHAAIAARELGIPCVLGIKDATKLLHEKTMLTVDGYQGKIYDGHAKPDAGAAKADNFYVQTKMKVKVNLSFPEMAKSIAPISDGVGFLRLEYIVLGIGEHPQKYINTNRKKDFARLLSERVEVILKAFHPKPVWIRTLDLPTDEYKMLEGSEDEPEEDNPMLGWRGIRRDLDQKELLEIQFLAFKMLIDKGFDNIGIFFPLIQHPSEYRKSREIAKEMGILQGKNVKLGIMVETPASALLIDDFIKEGIDFVVFGTNDLTQLTLGVDRNNPKISGLFTERHPAVLRLIETVIMECNKHGVETYIGGQAGSDPEMVKALMKYGISGFSVNSDAVPKVRRLVAEAESR